jgi:hypothetical protein
LESQQKLRALATYDNPNDPLSALTFLPNSFPALQIFDGPFVVGVQLLSSPITHLQLNIDHEMLDHFIESLPQLTMVHKTLRGLSLLDIPGELASKSLNIIAKACPTLRHVGLIPLPPINVSGINSKYTP